MTEIKKVACAGGLSRRAKTRRSRGVGRARVHGTAMAATATRLGAGLASQDAVLPRVAAVFGLATAGDAVRNILQHCGVLSDKVSGAGH